eukprot:431557-Lingulodinium_polyedra.AAC.1
MHMAARGPNKGSIHTYTYSRTHNGAAKQLRVLLGRRLRAAWKLRVLLGCCLAGAAWVLPQRL